MKILDIDNHNSDMCYTICIANILNELGIHSPFEKAVEITGYSEMAENWLYKSFLNLEILGFSTAFYDNADFERMATNFKLYYESVYGLNEAKQILRKTDSAAVESDLKRCIETPNINLIASRPNPRNLAEALQKYDYVLCFPNYWILNDKEPKSYNTHAVLVLESANGFYKIFDPGPPEKCIRTVREKLFWQAMYFPITDAATMLALKYDSNTFTQINTK